MKVARIALAFVLAFTAAAPTPHAADESERSAILVTDAAGRKVELAEVPRRLLVLGYGTFIVGHLLGTFEAGRERLVGMGRGLTESSAFLPLVDPTYESKVFLAPNPGPEQVARLRPDLVLSRGTIEDQSGRSLAQLQIPVAYLEMESPDHYFKDIALLGQLLDRPQRAEEIATFFRSRLEAVREEVSGLDDDERPRVLVAMAMPRGGRVTVQVPAPSWMQTRIIEEAGGAPVWLEGARLGDGWTIVTIEQIARWDPDWIFMVFWHSMDPNSELESFAADRHWSALKAVKEGRLRAFPADIYGWDSPDPRWILGLQWSAATLHPSRFPDFDMRAELYSFFEELYGMDVAAIETSILPSIRMKID